MGLIREFFGLTPKEYKSPKDYDLESFEKDKVYDIDLKPYLNSFLKSDWQGKVSLKNYRIYLSYGRREAEFKGIYRDADYSFIFVYAKGRGGVKNNGLACIGFDVQRNGDNSILVKQIQGVPQEKVPHVRKRLQPFRWEKLLLKIVVDWARENRFTKVKVIKAEDNYWFANSRREAMYMKYDVTARRSGFKFDQEEKVYVLSFHCNSIL